MPRGKAHSEETKAAVLAALLSGQSVTKVAADYKLNHATVIAWRDAAGLNGSTRVQPEKQSQIGELVIAYLRENLATLAVQARVFRDEAWLRGQDASEVAVLHGVLTDKALRILSDLEPADDGADQPT